MTYPSTREQDRFLSSLGVDPFVNNVEVVTVHTHDEKPMTAMYCFERDGQTFIATHWPDEHEEIT